MDGKVSGVLANVDQRTKLVGENRLELLMFRLAGRQMYAINVFKIQEVLKLPNLTMIPHRHPCVCGVTHFRGKTVPVINLSQSIGQKPLEVKKDATIIVTEYNRTVQAFLVGGVDRIVNMNWEEIAAPPKSAGNNHYLTAITKYKDEIVEIIDVEKVLAEIKTYTTDVSSELLDSDLVAQVQEKFVLLVDDSPVAINQAKGTISKLGLQTIIATNGMQAYKLLKSWANSDPTKIAQCLMVLTDAEMPEMDGYRLTTEIRADNRLAQMYVVMHTSLSGSFNKAMVQKVGCDDFLSKFEPNELANVVLKRIRTIV